jgi:hypothetical protein
LFAVENLKQSTVDFITRSINLQFDNLKEREVRNSKTGDLKDISRERKAFGQLRIYTTGVAGRCKTSFN